MRGAERGLVDILFDRATTDRHGGSNARGGSQVGGRQGGMNDAPLTNKVRVAPSPASRYGSVFFFVLER